MEVPQCISQHFSPLFQVSWLRRHDDDTPHLLTFGLTTYSNDARIQVGCVRSSH